MFKSFLAALLSAASAVTAVTNITAATDASTPAATYLVKKDIPYLETAGGPSLDMYTPVGADKSHRLPGFVWIHGGGWTGGTKGGAREVAVCTTLARAGFVTVSIDYVLADSLHASWPTNLEQCKAAIRFLRHNAALYGVDSAHIAVGGGSAGAHLAVMAGMTGEASFRNSSHAGYSGKVDAILDLYGPVSTYDWFGASVESLLGVTSKTDPLIRQSSAETYLSAKSPPVFIAHGLDDATVDPMVTKNFADRLSKAGAEHQLVLISGAGHSFTLEKYNGKPLSVDLKSMVLDWLNAKLRPAAALGRAEGGAPAGEVALELRSMDGRLVKFQDAANSPVQGPGLNFLTVRHGNRIVATRLVSPR